MSRLPDQYTTRQTACPPPAAQPAESMTDCPDPRELEDQAIEMLVHLHSGRASAADHLAYRNWSQSSAAHREASQEAEALWGALPLTQTAQQFVVTPPAQRRAKRLRALWATGLAACLATVVASGVLIRPWQALYADHVTALGERRALELQDGSQVWMNSDTVLSVDYSRERRAITLYQGQALFQVSKDPARPFIVHAAEGDVQAIGTRFDVDQRGDRVTVAVIEGIVQVSSGGDTVRLPAGHASAYRQGLVPQPDVAVDVQSVAAWQRGKLIFNARPLGEVLGELGRYMPGLVYLADDELATRRVSGIFELDDPQAALRDLQQTQPLRVTRLPMLTLVHQRN